MTRGRQALSCHRRVLGLPFAARSCLKLCPDAPSCFLKPRTEQCPLPSFAHKSVSGTVCDSDAQLPRPGSISGSRARLRVASDSDQSGQLLYVALSPSFAVLAYIIPRAIVSQLFPHPSRLRSSRSIPYVLPGTVLITKRHHVGTLRVLWTPAESSNKSVLPTRHGILPCSYVGQFYAHFSETTTHVSCQDIPWVSPTETQPQELAHGIFC